ncbi:MAG: signal recognition particle-docking protein FtsY [Myxococcales bacterium]|nr:signal recognition particle-docking protein FtsY [Myxococcales bacterium]
MLSLLPLALLAQVPPPLPPPPQEIGPGPGGLYGIVIGIAIGVALLLLGLLALRRALKKRLAAKARPALELPKEAPALKVELPPSELEQKRRLEAEEAHRAALELKEQREALSEAARAAEAKEKERLETEARALKEKEEEAKRAEYRAKKAAEAEEKERKRREAEETAKARAEAAARARAEEEERRRRAEEEERRRVEAQAGQTLAQGLEKTKSQGFMAKLNSFFGATPKQLDESVLGELEEILFTADIGVRTAANLVEAAREKAKRNELSSADRLKSVIRQEVERIVDLEAPKSLEGGGPPHVVMVVGVNGSGKTTTIGKLAAKVSAQGKKVVLAAGDTFRAAATEQLDVWAERAGAELVKGKEDADPASVVFDAIKRAKETGADVVIADTAGRLHTKAPLMEELKKVRRVMDKAVPGAPHEVLLVLDATNGQNAIQQAKQFQDAVGVTGIALTKLDGTAKGGVIIGICDELRIPVAWVGVGEKVADLRRFDPKEFVSALFD